MKQLLVAGALALAAQAAPATGITEGPRLAAIYELILQARFAQAHDALTRACPPAPPDACPATDGLDHLVADPDGS